MTKRSNPQKNNRSAPPSDGTAPTPKASPFPAMTSRDCQLLNQDEPDQKQTEFGKKRSFSCFEPSCNRRCQLNAGRCSTVFLKLMAKAGIDRAVTLPGGITVQRLFYSLRHSVTSWLAEADVHSNLGRKLTGHKSAGVHDLYTHHNESLKQAIGDCFRFHSSIANSKERA